MFDSFNALRSAAHFHAMPQWLRKRLESCDSDVDRLSLLVREYATLNARHTRFVQAGNLFIETLRKEG